MTRIAILGSTGSIGTSALEVIRHLGAPYRAVALSGHRQIERLAEQAREHRPAAVATADETQGRAVERLAREIGADAHVGIDGICEMVRRDDVDMVLAAIVGAAGVRPVLAAVQAGKPIALANKEALVVAGSLLVPEARRRGVQILPLDVMNRATPADALNHPTWRMGTKITIDSATMFNKALELIEACWMFDLPPEKVEVVVHPESVVHSMVEFVDGSVIAQLSPPDMRTPIQFALTYPERCDGIGRRLDLGQKLALHFEPPDFERFPALRLAYDVAERRGTLGAVLNGANEFAVSAFVAGEIPFGMISRVVELTIREHTLVSQPSLEDLLEADRWSREAAARVIQRL
jgi:1-deoxy-D-xylulose-5-phosphate reductoisomerase